MRPVRGRRILPFALLVGLALAAYLVLQRSSVLATSLPLRSDQDGFLAAAELFSTRLLVESKAPLYSVWLGIFHILSDHNPWLTFVREKSATLLLLGFGLGWLGYRMHSLATGAFLLLWVMSLKYLIIESNGSNAFASLLIVYGAIAMLRVSTPWKAPVGALTLFLASQARPEFAPILGLYLLVLGVRWLYHVSRRECRLDSTSMRAWLGVLLMILGVGATLRARMSAPPFGSSLAIYAGFAVTYVERNHLDDTYHSGWGAVPEVWALVFPTLSSPLDRSPVDLLGRMWMADRSELLGHLLYNAKRTPRILTAVLLGFQSRLIMVVTLMLYLAYLIAEQWLSIGGAPSFQTSREIWTMLAGLALLVPFAIVILPLWRYFIPLVVPLLLSAALLCSRLVGNVTRMATRTAGVAPLPDDGS